jgi:hypothetical protein
LRRLSDGMMRARGWTMVLAVVFHVFSVTCDCDD